MNIFFKWNDISSLHCNNWGCIHYCQIFCYSLQKFDWTCQSSSLDQLWHLKFPLGLYIVVFLRDGAAHIWKYLHWVDYIFVLVTVENYVLFLTNIYLNSVGNVSLYHCFLDFMTLPYLSISLMLKCLNFFVGGYNTSNLLIFLVLETDFLQRFVQDSCCLAGYNVPGTLFSFQYFLFW